jgi:hypothetical protein
MAKQINTRILLKYDSYDNWMASSFILKKGEAAICEMKNTVDQSAEPTILVKFGDGSHSFSQLPWGSALAADVYAWAKADSIQTEEVLAEGASEVDGSVKVFTGVAFNKDTGKLVFTYKYAAKASDITTALSDYTTKTDVATAKQEAITAASGDATTKANTALTSAKEYTDTLANGQVKTNKENIATLTTKVESLEVTGGQANVIEGVQVNGTDLPIANKKVNIDLANATVAKAGDADKLGGVAAADYATQTALADKADKATVNAMYTNAQIDALVQGAKDYADANDANDNTEYHVEYDSANKKIKLVAGADANKMEIDATDFIKDGMIDTVTIGVDNDLIITFNTAAGKENIVLPLDQLVDIYTGVEGAKVTVSVSADKKISADIVAGSIVKADLAADVQTSLGLADTALQEHQDISHLATKDEIAVVLVEAQEYANDLNEAMNTRVTAAEGTLATVAGEVGAKEAAEAARVLAQGVKDTVDQNKETWDKAGTALQAADLNGYAKTTEVTGAIEGAIANEVARADAAYAPKEATTQGIADANAAAEAAQGTANDAKSLAEAALPKATAEADYLKKTDAASTYRVKADKITSDDLSDEIWIFNCGSATVNIAG